MDVKLITKKTYTLHNIDETTMRGLIVVLAAIYGLGEVLDTESSEYSALHDLWCVVNHL